jgi:hypothetical protein
MAAMARRKPFCADVSRENGEPLGATASRIDHWLVVEYRGLWGRDLIRTSGLSDPVKERLRAQRAALPNARLLFVRRPERRRHPRLAVYHARSGERDSVLTGLEIDSYDDLLELGFASGLGTVVDHPLLVVCTHGKRDRCCARLGRPLYDELRAQAEEEWVWQSSHVGGDRFAGNVVWLPDGLFLGRVAPTDVWAVLDELAADRVPLEHYRGRSCYPFPVQAAERRLREDEGLTGLDDLRLLEAEPLAEDRWLVRFASPGDEHELEVVEELGERTYLTCEAAVPRRPYRYVATRRARARP